MALSGAQRLGLSSKLLRRMGFDHFDNGLGARIGDNSRLPEFGVHSCKSIAAFWLLAEAYVFENLDKFEEWHAEIPKNWR